LRVGCGFSRAGAKFFKRLDARDSVAISLW
jgi:hypothetical protein